MAHAHPAPQGWQAWVEEDTTVCRCEEVPYGEVVAARDELDLPDPRSLKGQTRAGMGLCQGRICGFAMTCIAAAGDRPPSPAEAARQVARRPLGVPITLGALRRARSRWQALAAESRRTGQPLDTRDLEARLLADDAEETTQVIGTWAYVGTGWRDHLEQALALAVAARNREYDLWKAERRRDRDALDTRGR